MMGKSEYSLPPSMDSGWFPLEALSPPTGLGASHWILCLPSEEGLCQTFIWASSLLLPSFFFVFFLTRVSDMALPKAKARATGKCSCWLGGCFPVTTLEDRIRAWLFSGQLATSATGSISVGEDEAKWVLLCATGKNVNWLQSLGGPSGSNFKIQNVFVMWPATPLLGINPRGLKRHPLECLLQLCWKHGLNLNVYQ